jgi:hypothetical protein
MVLNLQALENQMLPTVRGIEGLTKAIIGLGNAAHFLTTGELGNTFLKYAPNNPVETRNSMGRTPSNGSKPNAGSN